MMLGRRWRGAPAAAALAALISLVPLGWGSSAVAEGADASTELVLPAQFTVDPNAGKLPLAGLTGFLQGGWDGGYTWISYDGSRSPFESLGSTFHGTGSDVIVQENTLEVTLRDPGSGTSRRFRIPSGQKFRAVLGQSIVTYEPQSPQNWHLLTLDERGNLSDQTMSLPAGATNVGLGDVKTPYGFFVVYYLEGVRQLVWVGESFTPKQVDFGATATGPTALAAGRYLFRFPTADRLQIWDMKGDFSAPLHEVYWSGGTPVAVLGDYTLTRLYAEEGDRLVARPISGGPDLPVLDRITGDTPVGADGRVLAVPASIGNEVTVQSIVAGDSGAAPVVSRVAEIPAARTQVARTAMAQGVLQTYEIAPWRKGRLGRVELATGGALAAGPRVELSNDRCGGYDCSSIVPTGDGRTVLLGTPGAGTLNVLEEGRTLPASQIEVWPSGPPQASGRHVAYPLAGGWTDVRDLDTNQVLLHLPHDRWPLTSLEGATLWEGQAADGVVTAVDVRTGALRHTLKVADCDLKTFQAWAGFLYWKCDAKAGVRELSTGRDIAVPAHQSASLGDGYLAHQSNGILSVTPLRGDGLTREIGKPSRGGANWSVDRFGGHVSYVDDQERVHIVPTGVSAAPLSVLDSSLPGTIDRETSPEAAWTPRWWLSKPAASWNLTIKNPAGTVVRTLIGGEARGLIKTAWDGNDEQGKPLGGGRYTWELTAPPADGTGAELRTSGMVFLTYDKLSTFKPVPPARLLSTVAGIGAPKAKVGPRGTVTFQVTGRGGVAASGVSAVVLNVTATNASSGTFVSAYPSGTVRPDSSNLNVAAGRNVPNHVSVPVGKDG
ncbi:FlgD immunoglobulin-like domain containing protein, partial [Streptomyces sp. NPDC127114]|uniref:FlgD immunoglobulin-like domain containing protein n=1 Tax=Streptomyces sp. NPDC127114 TaxID=3345366 RepID=UPI00362C1E5F